MGKSTLMKALYNNCPHLSVYINLIKHNPFLAKKPDFETISNRFLQTDQTGVDLWKHLRKHLWQKGKLYMFLDGLDELNSDHVDCVLNFVKHASSEGGYIWLSTRENLRDTICQALNVVPIDIKELDEEEQKNYISSQLKKEYKSAEIKRITEAVFKSADLNSSKKLLGIPLLLRIITEMFIHNKTVYAKLKDEKLFVLSQMYKIYFEGKINFAHGKVVDINQIQQLGYLNAVLPMYEIPALTVCLQKEDCKRLPIHVEKAKKFLDKIRTEGDKNGIIRSVNENYEVEFEHQTYAEYFTCIWLKDHPKKLKKLGDKIFTKEYENLRLIFDVILAENSPLHLSLLYKDNKTFKKRLGEPNSEYDDEEGGRTAFHLAFSYGKKYPRRVTTKRKYLLELRRLKREEDYFVKIIKNLLKKGKIPDQKDKLFDFDCISYALKSGCLYPIEEILRTKSLSFDKLETALKECFDKMALAYCSAQFGYPNLLAELVKQDEISGKKEDLLEVAMRGCTGDGCAPPRDGNIAAVEILTGNDAIPETKMDDFLQEACEKKFFDMIEILTKNKAKCINGSTVLHHLVERCPETYRDEIVKTIEKFSIDLNAQNNDGVTALHKAAESADLKIVETLMEKGADPRIVDHDGRNVLHYASSNSRHEIIKLFLSKGFSVNAQDQNGVTALHLAAEKCRTDNVKILVAESADHNQTDSGKNNALHYASRSRTPNQPVIQLLMDKGMSVKEQNQDGQTPLHLACESGNSRNVEILLNQHTDLNLEDSDGNGLFNYALRSSTTHCKNIVKLLKSHGFDFNRKNQDGLAPIHFAFRRGNFAIADFLLEIGADEDIDARFRDGTTPLHWACRSNNYTVAIKLVERGADPNITDNGHRTALYHSFSQGYRPALVLTMLEHGLNPKTRYQDAQTLLHLACLHCDTHTVRKLCEKDVDVNILDDVRRSPLDVVLRSLPEIEESVKERLENRYKSDTSTQHEHEADKVQFGCARCYYELVNSLEKVAKDTSFKDFVREKLSKFINNDKILNIFLNDVVNIDPVNAVIDIVARFMIFEMVNYLIENLTELDYFFEQDYPEIGNLLNNCS